MFPELDGALVRLNLRASADVSAWVGLIGLTPHVSPISVNECLR
jgi:hypothetical protein